jgi:hypothetical protein
MSRRPDAHGWLVLAMLIAATLACATNTPVASLPTPRPTRTPLPTFTLTPLPPTPTPRPTNTDTPVFTDTPIPTATPAPTDTPIPSDTPAPTDTPTNPPAPPTNPPVVAAPPPTDTPVPPPAVDPPSPQATPTATPEPATPRGRYEIRGTEGSNNCAHIAVIGRVVEKGGSQPVQNVTLEVKGDKNPYKGPFFGRTNEKGDYTVLIGELKNDVNGVEFEIKVQESSGVVSEDKHKWKVSSDCHSDGVVQVMEVNWFWKSN